MPNSVVKNEGFNLKTDSEGRVFVDSDGLTSEEFVYAGGDVVSGSATVILAMEAGKKAAEAINKKFG